ncbi:MAG: hypothetical protein LC776_03940, partial [Acidobacteria bacterium]|nr:hypothetical protein [Acidobacteriota bacterium]
VCGLALSLPVVLSWRQSGLDRIREAIAIPLGVFFGLSGLTLIVAWSWRNVVAFARRRLRGQRSPTE